ncbi:hypothetical protein BD324DRAFT_614903 [Kockovaella imperatae]|uniref:[acyl-carrier-protein] S-malonyltransferase n=1 Tax=Kockovaella imperatae TaxID=4999 RepID=A0A1Y1UQK2_9TREE|nr:hypothetical protein BD324DRAFT_614903 [Kockovaella imperatae]ORX39764.1 hypothetical protein BD324DRAFT_614903 [Kockovaella imperatae]
MPRLHVGLISSPCLAGPSRLSRASSKSALNREAPNRDPRRNASTSSTSTTQDADWRSWLKRASSFNMIQDGSGKGKALLFAGLGSYPHTPYSPTQSSLQIWESASEALLNPDATIGYWPKGMEEFADALRGGIGIRGWLRGWVEGRSLDELMRRADVTAAFILTSSIAILASAQETAGSSSLLPRGTMYLAGHGFIGTLTALVAADRLDLPTGVRLAMMYASLSPSPSSLPHLKPKFLSTVMSARQFHSLSGPSYTVPHVNSDEDAESPDSSAERKRAMQLILDEVHGMQKGWWDKGGEEWAAPAIINSSKILVLSGTQMAVLDAIERLEVMGLANPVIDIPQPCPYHTRLMEHAIPKFRETLSLCHFRDPDPHDAQMHAGTVGPIILDPMATHPMGSIRSSLLPHLTEQLRWHKTLSRLYKYPSTDIDTFHTIGRGARGLGIMLRGEIKRRYKGAEEIKVEEFGVKPGESDREKLIRKAVA